MTPRAGPGRQAAPAALQPRHLARGLMRRLSAQAFGAALAVASLALPPAFAQTHDHGKAPEVAQGETAPPAAAPGAAASAVAPVVS